MTNTLTVNEVATIFNSDARTVRKFLRTQVAKESQPGKGSRWALPAAKRELNKLEKQFKLWSETQIKPEPEPELTREEIKEIDEDDARREDRDA